MEQNSMRAPDLPHRRYSMPETVMRKFRLGQSSSSSSESLNKNRPKRAQIRKKLPKNKINRASQTSAKCQPECLNQVLLQSSPSLPRRASFPDLSSDEGKIYQLPKFVGTPSPSYHRCGLCSNTWSYTSSDYTLSQTVSDRTTSTQDSTLSVQSSSPNTTPISFNSEKAKILENSIYAPSCNFIAVHTECLLIRPIVVSESSDNWHFGFSQDDEETRLALMPQSVGTITEDDIGAITSGKKETSTEVGWVQNNMIDKSTHMEKYTEIGVNTDNYTNIGIQVEPNEACQCTYKINKNTPKHENILKSKSFPPYVCCQKVRSFDVACSGGNYKDVTEADSVIARFSAVPRSNSMIVNTSSVDYTSDSDLSSDSLEDSIKEWPMTSHDNRLVRGEVTLEASNKKKYPKNSDAYAYFLSLNGEQDMIKEYPIPEWLSTRLKKREEEIKKLFEVKLNKTIIYRRKRKTIKRIENYGSSSKENMKKNIKSVKFECKGSDDNKTTSKNEKEQTDKTIKQNDQEEKEQLAITHPENNYVHISEIIKIEMSNQLKTVITKEKQINLNNEAFLRDGKNIQTSEIINNEDANNSQKIIMKSNVGQYQTDTKIELEPKKFKTEKPSFKQFRPLFESKADDRTVAQILLSAMEECTEDAKKGQKTQDTKDEGIQVGKYFENKAISTEATKSQGVTSGNAATKSQGITDYKVVESQGVSGYKATQAITSGHKVRESQGITDYEATKSQRVASSYQVKKSREIADFEVLESHGVSSGYKATQGITSDYKVRESQGLTDNEATKSQGRIYYEATKSQGVCTEDYEATKSKGVCTSDYEATRSQGVCTSDYEATKSQGVCTSDYEATKSQGVCTSDYEATKSQGVCTSDYEATRSQGVCTEDYGATRSQGVCTEDYEATRSQGVCTSDYEATKSQGVSTSDLEFNEITTYEKSCNTTHPYLSEVIQTVESFLESQNIDSESDISNKSDNSKSVQTKESFKEDEIKFVELLNNQEDKGTDTVENEENTMDKSCNTVNLSTTSVQTNQEPKTGQKTVKKIGITRAKKETPTLYCKRTGQALSDDPNSPQVLELNHPPCSCHICVLHKKQMTVAEKQKDNQNSSNNIKTKLQNRKVDKDDKKRIRRNQTGKFKKFEAIPEEKHSSNEYTEEIIPLDLAKDLNKKIFTSKSTMTPKVDDCVNKITKKTVQVSNKNLVIGRFRAMEDNESNDIEGIELVRQYKGRAALATTQIEGHDELTTLSKGWINFYLLNDNQEISDNEEEWPEYSVPKIPGGKISEERFKQYTVEIHATPEPIEQKGILPNLPQKDIKKKHRTPKNQNIPTLPEIHSSTSTSPENIQQTKKYTPEQFPEVARKKSSRREYNSMREVIEKRKTGVERELEIGENTLSTKAVEVARSEHSVSSITSSTVILSESPSPQQLQLSERKSHRTYSQPDTGTSWTVTVAGTSGMKNQTPPDVEMKLSFAKPNMRNSQEDVNQEKSVMQYNQTSHISRSKRQGKMIEQYAHLRNERHSLQYVPDLTFQNLQTKERSRLDMPKDDFMECPSRLDTRSKLSDGSDISSDLQVTGLAITPELKPRVPTQSERDLVRRQRYKFTR